MTANRRSRRSVLRRAARRRRCQRVGSRQWRCGTSRRRVPRCCRVRCTTWRTPQFAPAGYGVWTAAGLGKDGGSGGRCRQRNGRRVPGTAVRSPFRWRLRSTHRPVGPGVGALGCVPAWVGWQAALSGRCSGLRLVPSRRVVHSAGGRASVQPDCASAQDCRLLACLCWCAVCRVPGNLRRRRRRRRFRRVSAKPKPVGRRGHANSPAASTTTSRPDFPAHGAPA